MPTPTVSPRAGRDLGALACPSLVLWGDRDRYLPTRFAHAYADALPAAELEIARRGRPLALDRRPRVIDRVLISSANAREHVEHPSERLTSPAIP